MSKTPTTLIIMDGFGLRDAEEGNAVKNAPQQAGVGEIQQLRLAPGGQAPLLQNGAHGSVP